MTALKRLGAYSRGILWSPRARRILELSGWRLVDARVAKDLDAICGWALRPSAERPRRRAARDGLTYLALEDGFLRSLDLGLRREPPLSLLIDDVGVHYAAAAPSALERLLTTDGWETPELLARADRAIALLRRERISKYNLAPDRAPDLPPPGYVLVVDQTFGDASIAHGAATPQTFVEMLTAARDENPDAPIVVKTHPDVVAGLKRGHFSDVDLMGATLLGADVSPWTLIEGARSVYAVTSQMGFEALIAGKPVRVFGAPFYAGWGATQDALSSAAWGDRRGRSRSVPELVAAAYLRYPVYYDPFRDTLTDFETVAAHLALRRRVEAENRVRAHCVGVTLWKRGAARSFLRSTQADPAFHASATAAAEAAKRDGGRVVAWSSRVTEAAADAARAADVPFCRMEDGFLRSVGLGQALRTPASLAIDGSGVYYDPTGPSDLERSIAAGLADPDERARAVALRARIVDAAVTKYVLDGDVPIVERPSGRDIVLVVGQVEDDASIRCGSTDVRTNADLLRAARAARPDAWVIYKPHPDVEAGYRVGAVGAAAELADEIARSVPAPAVLAAAHEIWTITSLMGFEALLRGKRVVCCGWPFYAGWGLTEDRGAPPAHAPEAPAFRDRRAARPDLDTLVAATYLRYPRYVDPVTGQPCAAEVVLERLAARDPRMGRHANPLIRAFAVARAAAFSLRRPKA